ncbi:MAG TPA: sulfotransferase [Gammaproteobacteria bacterium]|nr:sulfotransferase [Gammaproteobacteria bacterium]
MSLARTCVTAAVGALNTGGRFMRRLGVEAPALEAEPLMQAARRRTGLGAFGDWEFEEPLDRLLRSYRDEARLTSLGRITVRELLVSLLANLLKLEQERRDDASIEPQTIEDPVFIIGLPRTGTTLLHGLMCQDPHNRVPLTWEVMYPAGYSNDPESVARIRRRTASRLAWANRLAPEFKRIHPIAPDLPQECIAITAQVFMSIQFHTTHNVPSYEDWFERDSQHLAYRFHHRLLQHLQARRPGRRWILKAPGHLFALRALLERYPRAKIVQTHRDPLRVMASMASHATVLRRAFSDGAVPTEIAADWTDRWARALDDFLAVRDGAPAGQFLDVGYDEIESGPDATLERIYDFLGWPLTDEARAAMRSFLAANPKNKHGVHRYSLSQYGLDHATERARFRRYCERFAIPMQADGV